MFFFSECLAHCNPQTCGYLRCIGMFSDLDIQRPHWSKSSQQAMFSVSKLTMGLNLPNGKIDPQVTVALVLAYCISLDASTACALHILVLLK